MDNPLVFLLIPVVLAVAVGSFWLMRGVRAGTTRAGARIAQHTMKGRIDDILFELAGTLVLHTSEPAAREIVDEVVLARSRHYLPLPDGGYGIRFLWADDTRVGLVDDQDGARLQIERFREYMGMPQTAPTWTSLRGHVRAAAEARGVAVSEGPLLVHVRGDLVDDDNAEWVLADEATA